MYRSSTTSTSCPLNKRWTIFLAPKAVRIRCMQRRVGVERLAQFFGYYVFLRYDYANHSFLSIRVSAILLCRLRERIRGSLLKHKFKFERRAEARARSAPKMLDRTFCARSITLASSSRCFFAHCPSLRDVSVALLRGRTFCCAHAFLAPKRRFSSSSPEPSSTARAGERALVTWLPNQTGGCNFKNLYSLLHVAAYSR